MAYLVLARKWRPQTFDDLIGQESIAHVLSNAIRQNKVAHAYIFSGPRGVGKTSTARILAKALNCAEGTTPEPCGRCPSCLSIAEGSSIDVSEIDGASNTGVDNIRDLRERIRYAPSGGRYKVYIIDEAHMLSTAAFNALLKTLEEPPAHVVFVLATTEPKKIPATVLSRCQHLPFRRLSSQKIRERLRVITSQEGISVTDPALDMIARAADGSMRDSLTILDQVASFSEDITPREISDLLGYTDLGPIAKLTEAVITGDRQTIINTVAELTDGGTDLRTLTKDLLQFVRNLLVFKIVGGGGQTVDLGEEELLLIRQLAETTGEEHLAIILSELIRSEQAVKNAFHPRVALEIALIRLSLLSHFTAVGDALRMIRSDDAPARDRPLLKTAEPVSRRAVRAKDDVTEKVEKIARRVQAPTPLSVPSEMKKPDRETPASRKELPLPQAWEEALGKLEEQHHLLVCKIREGTVSFPGDGILIVFDGGLSIHAESVKENLPVISGILSELAGKTVPIRVETEQGKTENRKSLTERALRDPVVREVLDLFEGRIVDVIPHGKTNNEQ